MAKAKPATEAVAASSKAFEAFITKEFGSGIMIPASMLIDKKREIIPTALSLDIALNGGIPEGTVCLISGKPKAGKTSLCLLILSNAQKMDRSTFYFDVERRCKPSLLKTVPSLDASKLTIIQSTKDCILGAEKWLAILERTIKDNPKSVIVVDSIAALSTELELAEAVGKANEMGGVSKLLASFFRKAVQIADANDVTLIFISQVMTNRDNKGKKYIEKGGMAVQYAVSVWINADWFKLWEIDPNTNSALGQDVFFQIRSSALGRPYLPCSVPLKFGSGFDVARDVVTQCENFGIVVKEGSWYTIPMFDNMKLQGIRQVTEYLNNNPDKLTALEHEIRRILLPDTVKNESKESAK